MVHKALMIWWTLWLHESLMCYKSHKICCRDGGSTIKRVGMSNKLFALVLMALMCSGGCASVRTLDAAQVGAPVIYSGTRLDWYALQGGLLSDRAFWSATA